MSKIYPTIHSFTGGLLSPKLEGRVDFAKYNVGCRVLENFIVTPTGGIYKRPGTRFVGKAKQRNVRLIPFDFNGTERQSYVLEVGDGYTWKRPSTPPAMTPPSTCSWIPCSPEPRNIRAASTASPTSPERASR